MHHRRREGLNCRRVWNTGEPGVQIQRFPSRNDPFSSTRPPATPPNSAQMGQKKEQREEKELINSRYDDVQPSVNQPLPTANSFTLTYRVPSTLSRGICKSKQSINDLSFRRRALDETWEGKKCKNYSYFLHSLSILPSVSTLNKNVVDRAPEKGRHSSIRKATSKGKKGRRKEAAPRVAVQSRNR